MELGSGSCRLSATSPDNGNAGIEIACGYSSDPIEIGFNAGYMLSMIANACPAGGEITLKMADAGSPTIVEGYQHGWMGVLMPMRV